VKKKLLDRAFAFLWLSETAFDIGSALMGFALGIWVFERTASAEQFSLTFLSAAVPALIMTPIAGTFADRFDRRWVIASCDLITALMVVVLTLLLFHDRLAVEHLYLFNAVAAIVGMIRNPSFLAAVGAMVPKDRLTQANGLIGFTQGLMQIGAPLMAGYLMAAVGLKGITVVELIMVSAGAAAMFTALSHAPHAIRGTTSAERLPLLNGITTSFSDAIGYFGEYPLMAGLLVYTVLQEALVVLVSTMITPLVLSTHSSDVLGLVMTSGAIGTLVGALLLMAKPVNQRLVVWILVSNAGLSVFVLLAGLTVSPGLWSLYAFFALFAGSVSEACAGALWMRKAPKEKQGSIFALIGALNLMAMCVVMLGGASLGERIFEPALAPGGLWADSIGTWVGTGKGRGYGLLFIVSGTLGTLISLVALAQSRLRHLDELVGDQTHSQKESLAGESGAGLASAITASPAQ
jgi:diaminobutyrate-2-oxoglutarate transaminase